MQDQPPAPSAAPEAPTNPPVSAEPAATTPQPKSSKNSRGLKTWVVALIAAVVVLGGSAAAYFGIVVPNKPENKLKKAVQNLSEQQATTIKGNIDVTSADTAANVGINMLHIDPDKKVALADVVVTISGIKLPIEVRYVDNTAFIKLGDLSTIKSLLAGFGSAEAAPLVDVVDSKVSNQWIEIDRTFLNQMTQGFNEGLEKDNNCTAAETGIKLRTGVNELLEFATNEETKIYTIDKTSTETVDGETTTKLELSLDDSKIEEFGKKAGELPAVKELEKCFEGTSSSQEAEEAAGSGKITTLNVWISGDKQIKRFEVVATAKENDQDVTTKFDLTMVGEAPTVEKPTGAKPIMQLVGELQSLFGGGNMPLDSLGGSLSL